ncbi:MAG: glycosyltransferase family 2 protein, partial [candidate division WOR-3 bacterium]|nr:glycosyltransferase family 2 protein [candidate division WOR-3 bacterium]
MVEASVIIPSHNRRELLEYSLAHILNQTTDNYEVILIDDASTDGTHNLIGNWKLEIGNLRYIRLERQSGPYVARNIGIREAKGDIIIFIDSDVLVHSRFVEDHTKIHKRYDKIILQGMVHHTRVPSLATFKFFFPNAFCFRTFIT